MNQGSLVSRPPQSRTIAEFLLVSMIWGSTWLVIKGQLGIVPAAWSVAYRFIIASVTLFVICHFSGRWQRLGRSAHGFALIAGTAQFALNFNLVYAAEQRLTSGLVALVFALLIVPNAIFARIFLKVTISARFVVGSLLGLAGLGLVFAHDLIGPGANLAAGAGLALAGSAVLCASIGNVMQATGLARSLPPLPMLGLIMFYGSLIDCAYAFATTGGPTFDPRPEYWLGLAYLAIIASIVAFSVYYGLIRRIGPGPAAYSNVVVPVVAMALSTIFEGYHWTATAAIGALLALAGLVIALDSRRAKA